MALSWTDQQREAITSSAPTLCVDAGAGSGKTFVLVKRLVHLIEARGANLDRIVAITFTEKAAAEMKSRLRRAFRALASEEDRDVMTRWRTLERKVDSARITTIHSFCAGILREHAMHLGIDPDFNLLADAEQRLFEDRVLTETLHDLLERGDEDAMMLARAYRFGAIVDVLKGLGAKRALVDRFRRRYPCDDVDAFRRVAGEQAAAAHADRMRLLADHPAAERYLRELEGFADANLKPDKREAKRRAACDLLRSLRDGASPEEIERLRVAYDEGDLRGVRATNWTDPETFNALTDVMKQAHRWIDKHLKAPEVDPATERLSAALTCALYRVHDQVQRAIVNRKRVLNALDFDDLLERANEALCSNEALRARVAADIDFLLIDEFQDTDSVQLELALALHNHPGGPDLFIVGDAKQSIYRFRGADVTVFKDQRGRSEVLPLNLNFRSLPDVLDFVNDYHRQSGALWAVEPVFQDLATFRPSAGGTRIEFLIPGQEPGRDDWKKRDGREREAWMIAQRIRSLCGDDAPSLVFDEETEAFRRAQPGDFALLFRALSNVALYEEALREAGIPYTLIAGGGFYERQEVLDFLNILKVLLDPWDESALFAFLRSPVAALSDVDLFWLAREGTLARVFYSDIVPPAMPHPDRLQRARSLLTRLRGCRMEPLGALLQRVLEESDLEAISLGLPQGVQRAANLRKLQDLGQHFTNVQPPTLRAFVRYLDDVRSKAVREGEAALQAEGAGAVTIMSVHKSKGLEFPIVFLPDISGGGGGDHAAVRLHPEWGLTMSAPGDDGDRAWSALGLAIQAQEKIEEESESARLLYVAMTRARDMLFLSGTVEQSSGTWFDALNQTFKLLEREPDQPFCGPGWEAVVRRDVSPAAALRKEKTAAEQLPAADALARHLGAVAPVAAPEGVVSVSTVLDLFFQEDPPEGSPEAQEGGTVGSGRTRALDRGTAVHRYFEAWDFPGLPPAPAPILAASGLARADRQVIAEELAGMSAWFRGTDLYTRLRSGGGLQREAPFLWTAGGGVVSGTIDLLVDQTAIVDYKTGRYTDAHAERYRLQLALYAAAVADIMGATCTEGFLVYVDEQRVEEVSLTSEMVDRAREAVSTALLGLTPGTRVG